MKIVFMNAKDIKDGPWRSTFILKPDLKALASSLNMFGWAQPLVVHASTNQLIDGHERLRLVANNSLGNQVPVFMFEGDSIDAALLHLHLNRDRGDVKARDLSRIIKQVLRSRKFNEEQLMKHFSIGRDEFEVLLDGTLLKQRKVAEHNYSKAWVPIEAAAGSSTDISFERPPTSDQGDDVL